MWVNLSAASWTSNAAIFGAILLVSAILLTLLVSTIIGILVKGRPRLLCQGLGSLLLLGSCLYLACQGKPPVFMTGCLILGWVMGMGDIIWVRANGSATPIAMRLDRR